MNEDLRNPQVINGEMFPRNHYLGLESVRKLHELVGYLKTYGINMMAIPIINEVEAGLLNQDLPQGTILGLAAPIMGQDKELTQVLVWDGHGIVGVSILMYLHKAANNWRLPGEDGYQKPNLNTSGAKGAGKEKNTGAKNRRSRRSK